MFHALRNPDIYHGNKRCSNYFEGWYFKLVQPKTGYVIAIIPGIFKSNNKGASHSFVQILDGSKLHFNYFRFPPLSFISSNKEFKFVISDNMFSLYGIELNIKSSEINIHGSVRFYNIKKWPDSMVSPGSMGFYNYLSFMQCYSQVCALSGDIEGSLIINSEEISFNGGNLYIEKNWGKDFPYSWAWIQCSSFKMNSIALTCSIGYIPFPLGNFRGFLIGMYCNNDFYKFTSMNKSKLTIKAQDTDVLINVRNRSHTLSIKTHSVKEDFLLINGPRESEMISLVKETLTGEVDLMLTNNADNKCVVEDYGYYAGIEYGGNQSIIIKNL